MAMFKVLLLALPQVALSVRSGLRGMTERVNSSAVVNRPSPSPETLDSLRAVMEYYEKHAAGFFTSPTSVQVSRAVADMEAPPRVGPPVPEPSIFVVVMSRRDAFQRRALIRDMWMRITGASGNVTARFAICKHPEESTGDDKLDASLQEEKEIHGDVLILSCSEGYGHGFLTRKALAAMEVFSQSWFRHDLFMKIDDDAFVRWSRFSKFLVEHSHGWVYMGIPIGMGVPCRNESFQWYEPYSTFPDAEFPMAMAGGSGYTLGKDLVLEIVKAGIGKSNVLWNEDRAVGVWVDKLVQVGKKIEYVAVPGIDGWWAWDWEHPANNWAKWGEYDAMVHHGLLAETISCLALADRDNDPAQTINHCLKNEAGQTHEAFHCWEQNSDASSAKSADKHEHVKDFVREEKTVSTAAMDIDEKATAINTDEHETAVEQTQENFDKLESVNNDELAASTADIDAMENATTDDDSSVWSRGWKGMFGR